MQRPFISLKEEFYNRPTWRRMILCLVTSPVMFRKAGALLHSWFLITGLTFVLEVHIALVSAVLDMVCRPMAWGVSMEMGLKFPFAHAYFPNKFQELLAVLNGSISGNNFLVLVHYIKASLDPTICYSSHETMLASIDNNSTWSMLMKSPTWFYFASVLIFYYKDIQDSYISQVISNERNFGSANDENLNEAAIFYISYVLNPVGKGHGDRLAYHFLKLSSSWSSSHKGSFSALASWLEEFDGVCVKSWIKPFLPADCKGEENYSTRSRNLFIKIPLGIFILYPGILTDKGCELLLYYATTGEILQYHEHEITLCYGSNGRKWAFDGAGIVFSVFDIIEQISVMLFDCEATRLDFICYLKGKGCKYLLRCVEILFHLCIQQLVEIRGRVALVDLYRKLIHWKRQGREVFEGWEEFNDVVDAFANKFLTSKELEEEILA